MPLKCMTIKKRKEKQWEQCFFSLLIILRGFELLLQTSVCGSQGQLPSPRFTYHSQPYESSCGPACQFQQLHFPLACLFNLLLDLMPEYPCEPWTDMYNVICKLVRAWFQAHMLGLAFGNVGISRKHL